MNGKKVNNSVRSPNTNQVGGGGFCPPPTLKQSVSLGPSAVTESRRLLASVEYRHKNYAGRNNHFMPIGVNHSEFRRKVTPSDDEVENYPIQKQKSTAAPRATAVSPADDGASLAEAIKQYRIAHLNLEAQLKAREAANDFAASERIKRDLGLLDPFKEDHHPSTTPSPPTLSRKTSISHTIRPSVGLDKIRKSVAVIETENKNTSNNKPHRSARGYHGTLCLKSNLVEEDGEEDDETALHVGFSDQWDDVLMARAVHESKMSAMNSNAHRGIPEKTQNEDSKIKANNSRLADPKVSVTQNIRAATWPAPGYVDNRALPSSNQATNIPDFTAGTFAFPKRLGAANNNANNHLMDLFATDYQEQLRQVQVDSSNTASLKSLFPTINPQLRFPNAPIGPLNTNNENMLNDLVSKSYTMQPQGNLNILEQIVQKYNLSKQEIDRLFGVSSLLGYAPTDVLSLLDSRAQLGNNTFSLGGLGETGIGLQLPKNSQLDLPVIDNSTTDMRNNYNLAKKRPSRNISSTCLVCRKSFAYEDKHGEKEFVCHSCAFLQNKKTKPNYSDIDSSTVVTEDQCITVDCDEKWDLIPSNAHLVLATDEDSIWLSDLLCFIRRQIEVFTATPSDVAARSRRGGIKQPIAVGRVGIRCIHCGHINPDSRAKGAVSYPNSIRIVHQAIRNWQRYHFMECSHISDEVREMYYSFKTTRSHSGNASLKFWVSSCLKLGMVDTDPENGIRWRDPKKVRNTSAKSDSALTGGDANSSKIVDDVNDQVNLDLSSENVSQEIMPYRELPPALLEPGEEKEISPFLAVLLAQQKPTHYTSIDKLGKRKSRPINYPGVECRHCNSRVAGSGRYFPLTVTTFANNNNPNNCIHTHMIKCSRCPQAIKDKLMILENRHVTDAFKLETGWKKKFFDRLWFRLHGKECMSTRDQVKREKESPMKETLTDMDSLDESLNE